MNKRNATDAQPLSSRVAKRARIIAVPWRTEDESYARLLWEELSQRTGGVTWNEYTIRYNEWARDNNTTERTLSSLKTKVGAYGRSSRRAWTTSEDQFLSQLKLQPRQHWNKVVEDMRSAGVLSTERSSEAVRRRFNDLKHGGIVRDSAAITEHWSRQEDEILRSIGFNDQQLTQKFNAKMKEQTGLESYHRLSAAVIRRVKELSRQSQKNDHQRAEFVWTATVESELDRIRQGSFRMRATRELAKRLGLDVQVVRYHYNKRFQQLINDGLDIALNDTCTADTRNESNVIQWGTIQSTTPATVDEETITIVRVKLNEMVQIVVDSNEESSITQTNMAILNLTRVDATFILEDKANDSDNERSPSDESGLCKDAHEATDTAAADTETIPPVLQPAESDDQLVQSQCPIWREISDKYGDIDSVFAEPPSAALDTTIHDSVKSGDFRSTRSSTSENYRYVQGNVPGSVVDQDISLYQASMYGQSTDISEYSDWKRTIITNGRAIATFVQDHDLDWMSSTGVRHGESFCRRILFLRLSLDFNHPTLMAFYRDLEMVGVRCGLDDCCIQHDMTAKESPPVKPCLHQFFSHNQTLSVTEDENVLSNYRLWLVLATLCEAQATWRQFTHRRRSRSKQVKVEVKWPKLMADRFTRMSTTSYLHLATMNLVVIEAKYVPTIMINGVHEDEELQGSTVGWISTSNSGFKWKAALVVDRGRWFFVVMDKDWPLERYTPTVIWEELGALQQQIARMEGAIRTEAVELLEDLMMKRIRVRGLDRVRRPLPSTAIAVLDGLNDNQRRVILKLWHQDGLLPVRGCFGCGKSTAIAALGCLVDRSEEECISDAEQLQYLVVAESNVAVDACLSKLLRIGNVTTRYIVRLGRSSAEDTQIYSSEWMIQSNAEALLRGQPFLKEREAYKSARSRVIQVVREARIVLCTFSQLSSDFAKYLRPTIVVVDEAGTVLEAAIPQTLFSTVKSIGFFGDPKQRPPFSFAADDRSVQPEVLRSIMNSFSAAWFSGWPGDTLNDQYRCHPQIGQLCERIFYDYKLDHCAKASEDYLGQVSVIGGDFNSGYRRIMHLTVDPPNEPNPISNGGRNEAEALCICECLMSISAELRLLGLIKGVLVVSPYKEQVKYLKLLFGQIAGWWSANVNVRVCTVDSCQGDEEDVVIMSFGWRNPDHHIGFLATSAPRLLVPLSRAKDYLILLLHGSTFVRLHPQDNVDDHWNLLLQELEDDDVHQHYDRRSMKDRRRLMQDLEYYQYLSYWDRDEKRGAYPPTLQVEGGADVA